VLLTLYFLTKSKLASHLQCLLRFSFEIDFGANASDFYFWWTSLRCKLYYFQSDTQLASNRCFPPLSATIVILSPFILRCLLLQPATLSPLFHRDPILSINNRVSIISMTKNKLTFWGSKWQIVYDLSKDTIIEYFERWDGKSVFWKLTKNGKLATRLSMMSLLFIL